jgi:hypothetical protein
MEGQRITDVQTKVKTSLHIDLYEQSKGQDPSAEVTMEELCKGKATSISSM